MKQFYKQSRILGENVSYVQGRGGNTSYKVGGDMYIKSSGYLLKEVNEEYGFVRSQYKDISSFFTKHIPNGNNERKLNELIENTILQNGHLGTPSLETGMHAVINSKFVIHTHSVYANVFNCISDTKKYLKLLMKNYPVAIIPYRNPGYHLASYIAELQSNTILPTVLFLKNHGLVLHGDRMSELIRLHSEINEILRVFIQEKTGKTYTIVNHYKKLNNHMFPDSIVYDSVSRKSIPIHKLKEFYEILSAELFIRDVISHINESPSYISKADVKYIQEMDKEKHRMNQIRY